MEARLPVRYRLFEIAALICGVAYLTFVLRDEARRIEEDRYITTHFRIGKEHMKFLRFRPAAEEFEKVLRIRPHLVPALLLAGESYANDSRADDALRACHQALIEDPRAVTAYRGLGLAFERIGAYEAAIHHYEEGFRLGDEPDATRLGVARCLLMQGNAAGALDHARAAYQANPTNLEARWHWGKALRTLGRPGEALEHLEAIADQAPTFSLVYPNVRARRFEDFQIDRARLQIELGQYQKAEASLKPSLQSSVPQIPRDAYTLMGDSYAGRGDHAAARTYYDLATRSRVGYFTGVTDFPTTYLQDVAPARDPADSPPVAPAAGATTTPGTAIRFLDATAGAGLGDFQHSCGPLILYNPEVNGPGVAFLDYDADGFQDLYLISGADARSDGSLVKTHHNRLYRNRGDGTFADVTEAAGARGDGFGMGVVAGDPDNDGYSDIYLVNYETSMFLRNQGDGTFIEEAAAAGIAERGFGMGAAFGDHDRDGFLDLFVTHYNDHDYRNPPPDLSLARIDERIINPNSMGPFVGNGEDNTFYRNRGDGTFEDVTTAAGLRKGMTKEKSMGVVFTDVNHDGWPDLFVANDEAGCHLFLNTGKSTFVESASRYWVADTRGNMGVAAADYNQDGLIDLAVTHWYQEENALYRQTRRGIFADVTQIAGLHKRDIYLVAWGLGFFDFDNDGLEDLFITNGNTSATHYDPLMYLKQRNPMEPQPDVVYRQVQIDRFEDVSLEAGLEGMPLFVGRGLAGADVENDGRVDVITANNNGPVLLYGNRSETASGSWLLVQLVGTVGNRDAAGARVMLRTRSRTQLREVQLGSSYLSAHAPILHYGLGTSRDVDALEIEWPSGRRQILKDLDPDRMIRVHEPAEVPGSADGGQSTIDSTIR